MGKCMCTLRAAKVDSRARCQRCPVMKVMCSLQRKAAALMHWCSKGYPDTWTSTAIVATMRRHSTFTMRLVDHCHRRLVDSNRQIMTATQHSGSPGHSAISASTSYCVTIYDDRGCMLAREVS